VEDRLIPLPFIRSGWVTTQIILCDDDAIRESEGTANLELPKNTMFYHKTGWYSYWTNDVGIVDDGEVRYIIACFLPVSEKYALEKFRELSKQIYQLIRTRNIK